MAVSALTARPGTTQAPLSPGVSSPARAVDFPSGAMAGEVTPHSAVLWTRLAGAGPLTLTLSEEDRAGRELAVLRRPVQPGEGGYTHAEVDGLRPGTRYRYQFTAEKTGAQVGGRFRTALAPDSLEPVTFGATSCTDHRHGPIRAMESAARRELDFFVHLGDHVYCDGAKTLDGFREQYAEAYATNGLDRVHRSTSTYATWDDHEVANGWNPETIDPRVLSAARRAYLEHLPLRPEGGAARPLYKSFKWGKAAELFLLDCRSERKPSTRTGANAQFISREQLKWLKEGLSRSDSVFKLIATSVPIGQFPFLFDLAASDRWEGYASQRRELLDFLRTNQISGVWFLTGDFHFGAMGRVGKLGTPDFDLREVMVGPGGSRPNPLSHTLRTSPQWEFVASERNYGVFRADPKEKTLEVSFFGEDGTRLFSRRYDQDGRPVSAAEGSRVAAARKRVTSGAAAA